jgi:predicted  nucleic acid-binding Zn-ribbon protein
MKKLSEIVFEELKEFYFVMGKIDGKQYKSNRFEDRKDAVEHIKKLEEKHGDNAKLLLGNEKGVAKEEITNESWMDYASDNFFIDEIKKEIQSFEARIKYAENRMKNIKENWEKKEYQAVINSYKKSLDDAKKRLQIVLNMDK